MGSRLSAGIALNACNAGNPPPADNEGDYVTQIQVERAAQDEAFRNQPDQPVPPDKQNSSCRSSTFHRIRNTSSRPR